MSQEWLKSWLSMSQEWVSSVISVFDKIFGMGQQCHLVIKVQCKEIILESRLEIGEARIYGFSFSTSFSTSL